MINHQNNSFNEDIMTAGTTYTVGTNDGKQIFKGYALGGLVLAIAGSTMNVLMCLIFNLITNFSFLIRFNATSISYSGVRVSNVGLFWKHAYALLVLRSFNAYFL